MKKIIISLMLLITILLTICIKLFSIKDETDINKVYYKETINYLDDNYYSTSKEEITITDDRLLYKKNITYNSNKEDIVLQRSYSYESKDNQIITNKQTYYLIDDKICLDKKCNNYLSTNNYTTNNYINNLKQEDYLKEVKDINSINKNNKTFIVITKTGCSHCTNIIKNIKEIINEYDITFYLININKANEESKKYITETLEVDATPTILIFDNNKLINKKVGELTYSEISNLLFSEEIKSR